MRILSLMTQRGETDYPDTPDQLRELFKLQFPGDAHKLILLDTGSHERFSRQKRNGLEVIGVSNRYREFSGFSDGIAALADELPDYDLINIVTAAFLQPPIDYLQFFTPGTAEFALKHGCALGNIDAYGERIRLYDTFSRHWLRTSFVLLRPDLLRRLQTMAPVTREEDVFGPDWQFPFRENGAISRNYQDILLEWLVGAKNEKLVESWHSKFVLSAETYGKFKAKALSILNEHSFSINLRDQGVRLADVTWVHNNLKHIKAIPDWEEQAQNRFPRRNRHPF